VKEYYLGSTLSVRDTMIALLVGERLIDTGKEMFLSLKGAHLIFHDVGDPHCTGHTYVGSLYGWHKFKVVEEEV
jgi:hypothetical protein